MKSKLFSIYKGSTKVASGFKSKKEAMDYINYNNSNIDIIRGDVSLEDKIKHIPGRIKVVRE